MAKKNGYTAKQFIKAIPGTGGVISTIARKVGCTWHTAAKYLKTYPTITEAYEAECNTVTDFARSVVIDDIVKKRRIETAKWWLVNKASDEFSSKQKHEVTGKDGAPLYIVNWDDDENHSG